MDIATFVRDSLADIAAGVADANDAGSKRGYTFEMGGHGSLLVEFDIAVVATKEGKAGAGIAVLSVEIGGHGTVTHESASRIKFAVRVRNTSTGA